MAAIYPGIKFPEDKIDGGTLNPGDKIDKCVCVWVVVVVVVVVCMCVCVGGEQDKIPWGTNVTLALQKMQH